MTSPQARRRGLRRLGVGAPVLVVLAVLSSAAVVGLVHDPTLGFAAVDASVEQTPGPSTAGPSLRVEDLPDALPEVGAYATSTVRADGVVEVVEWMRTSEPTTSLTLSMPLGSPASSTADDVVVTSADEAASGPTQVTSSGSYLVSEPATLFVARYLLDGAARLSPSSQTRALVRPIALTIASDGPEGEDGIGPRLISIGAGTVLALACAIRGQVTALEPCGAPADDDRWELTLDATRWSTLVAAQVDLG